MRVKELTLELSFELTVELFLGPSLGPSLKPSIEPSYEPWGVVGFVVIILVTAQGPNPSYFLFWDFYSTLGESQCRHSGLFWWSRSI